MKTARERLIEAAASLLHKEGRVGATARKICDQAGVKAPTLYHHFGDLDGLYRAVIEVAFETAVVHKEDAPLAGKGEVVERIRDGFEAYIRFAADHPALFSIIAHEVISGGLPQVAAASHSRLIELLQMCGDDMPSKLSAEQAANLVWATAHGAASLVAGGHMNSDSPELQALLNTTVKMISAKQPTARDSFAELERP